MRQTNKGGVEGEERVIGVRDHVMGRDKIVNNRQDSKGKPPNEIL